MSRGDNLQRYAPSPVPPTLGPDLLAWLAREFQKVANVQNHATWDGIEDIPSELPPAPHEHLEADITDLDRVRWAGQWATGTYQRNDMVRDGLWLMVANTATTDPAAPEAEGEEWQLVPEPTWSNHASATTFGLRLDPADAILMGVRAKVPNAGVATIYLVTPEGRIDIARSYSMSANTWHEWYIRPILISGQTDLVVEALSYMDDADYLSGDLSGFSCAAYPPTGGEISTTAYGADMLLDRLIPSPDWDVLAWQS